MLTMPGLHTSKQKVLRKEYMRMEVCVCGHDRFLAKFSRQRERNDYAMSGVNLFLRAQMQGMLLSVQIKSDG